MDDSSAKMVICQTITPGIRTQIADFPTAHAMWEYLARRYCGSSQAQLYTLYQTLSGLQQGMTPSISSIAATTRSGSKLMPTHTTNMGLNTHMVPHTQHHIQYTHNNIKVLKFMCNSRGMELRLGMINGLTK